MLWNACDQEDPKAITVDKACLMLLQDAGMASQYDVLTEFFNVSDPHPMQMEFREVERVLGFHLPRSARDHDAWWLDESDDTSHMQAKAWLAAGRRVLRVDRDREFVRFSARESQNERSADS